MKTTLQLYNYYDKVAETISLWQGRDRSHNESLNGDTDYGNIRGTSIGVYLDVLCIDKKGYREQITWRAKELIDGKRKYKYH